MADYAVCVPSMGTLIFTEVNILKLGSESLLLASCRSQLASRKGAVGNYRSEGSGTAKVGTDPVRLRYRAGGTEIA
ncbi:MAG: hypothetical protein GY705_12125 [Bacteroidetes bacterium]|nr:hypothetical protein [Bacteroidota bacterium]